MESETKRRVLGWFIVLLIPTAAGAQDAAQPDPQPQMAPSGCRKITPASCHEQQPGMQRLDQMIGDWEVKGELCDSNEREWGRLRLLSERYSLRAQSSIKPIFDGRFLLEKIDFIDDSIDSTGNFTVVVIRSYDVYQKEYRDTYLGDYNTLLEVYEGCFVDDDNNRLITEDPGTYQLTSEGRKRYFRVELTLEHKDRFRLDVWSTEDDGKTWDEYYWLIYSRD